MTLTQWVTERPSRYTGLLAVLMVTLVMSCVVCTTFGAAPVPLRQVAGILMSRLFDVAPSSLQWTAGQETIVWLIRTPRVLLGALVGAGLALIGTVLQAVTRNPLADPHLLGATSGATLGAVIVVMHVGEVLGMLTLPLAAFTGALTSLCLVLWLSSRQGRLESHRLLLGGVAVSFVMMAIANLMLFLGDHRASSSVIFWMLGGLGLARWELLLVPLFTVLAGWMFLQGLGRSLNALMVGDQTAASLGLQVRNVRLLVFLIASLMTGVLVALCGAIGFVGLMVPHIARRLVGSEHRRLLPVAALLGALLMIWVDVISRTLIAPEDLPIGIATALLGGLFFIFMMRRG
ncbi:iron ABC transporter permease [Pseudomonas sp. CDFA 602]|uniref:FecCD family ABC transporter permease n=1 Tax=Pseudomonas californiensis TaxID=2829823 RepID=UPI001E5B2DCF|nr:iron ABC transporter permease [Pseudomonas californiensis]MCD5995453.1 iron ABC transporter permease [Pseudomonas californiensis]MCD6000951.1 iron ABC transporter permease [Pseudomonas californiensis]